MILTTAPDEFTWWLQRAAPARAECPSDCSGQTNFRTRFQYNARHIARRCGRSSPHVMMCVMMRCTTKFLSLCSFVCLMLFHLMLLLQLQLLLRLLDADERCAVAWRIWRISWVRPRSRSRWIISQGFADADCELNRASEHIHCLVKS